MKPNLPQWAKLLLATCPQAGTGVHNWLFRAALKLHPIFADKSELERTLAEAVAECGRNVEAQEIEDAVCSSQTIRNPRLRKTRRNPRWPARNEARISEILQAGPSLAIFESTSPVRWSDDLRHTEEIIDALFPGNVLLCAGPTKKTVITRPREVWRGSLAKQELIVPSPMARVRGMNKKGKSSRRCLDNTGPRRFLVTEFDQGTSDEQATIISHLSKFAPLVLVVHSGNKSLHGWFYCAGDSAPAVEKFFCYAVSVGADPATWTKCQLVRMPDGQRSTGSRQRVIYFNPEGITN